MAGLSAAQTCTVSVSNSPDFSNPIEISTDSGGAAMRTYVVGRVTPLAANTSYYVGATCGTAQGNGQFTATANLAPIGLTVPVTIFSPTGRGIASVQLDYGNSPQLGSSVTLSCPNTCRAYVPATSGSIVYMRRSFLDANAQTVARSEAEPVIAK